MPTVDCSINSSACMPATPRSPEAMTRPADNQSAPPASDAFELWRQIYETNERAWNAVLERTVASPAFAESSGKLLETFLAAQKTIRDNMRAYLEAINVPTREEIARL